MSPTQQTLTEALAHFEAAERRLKAAIAESSKARVLTRITPRSEWSPAEQQSWIEQQAMRYDAAVLNEARAEAAFERAKDRVEAAILFHNEACAVHAPGPGELPDRIEQARR